MQRFKALFPCLALVVSMSVAASDASAASVDIGNDSGSLGTYTGNISYDSSQGLLTILLENTSPAANGGFITGFLFNINGDATATLSPDPQHNFQGVNNENGAPFGTFEAGAALGANWQGGGNPNPGIGVGQSASFEFAVAGNDAGSLTATDFITKTSSQGSNSAAFLVRFRGFEDGGGDKVPGVVSAPSPAAAGAGLMLLGGLMMRRRSRTPQRIA